VEDLVRPRAADARDQALVAKERMQPPRLAVDDLPEPLRPKPERLGPEVGELGLRRLWAEEPHSGPLLPRVLGQDQLRAAVELEPEGRRLRALVTDLQVLQPARRHEMDEKHELAVVGRKEEALAAPLGTAKTAAFERRHRRVERLERGDVRGAGLRDREGRHRVVQLAPPRLHLR
jgi:hypothetical protein